MRSAICVSKCQHFNMRNDMKLYRIIIVFFASLFFSSCSEKGKELNPDEYKAWMKDAMSNLSVDKTIGAYHFGLDYQPLDYLLLKEMDHNATATDLANARAKRDGLQYFVLRLGAADQSGNILRSNLSSEEEYYRRLEYYSANAQRDISLIDGTDTLACSLYHFERYYNAAPFDKLVLAFEKGEKGTSKTLVYNDQVLGVGPVAFHLSEDIIENIPQLIIKE